MRDLEYEKRYRALLSPGILKLVSSIHEWKGKQELYISERKDDLRALMERAKIRSTDASNRIEGILASGKRLEELVRERTEPRNRSEQEIAGYRDVLALIHESHEFIDLRPNHILQLHQKLYSFTGVPGGHWKTVDNRIEEVDADGRRRIRFQPLSAVETPQAMEELCREYDDACRQETLDILLLTPLFILDFLCIHPFHDGNGRMSRLLLLLLLYRSDYLVGKYVSLEGIIEQTKDQYYEALKAGSEGWHDGTNDDLPFVEYSLSVLNKAYREFAERVEGIGGRGSKTDRIRRSIETSIRPISKRELLERNPDISTSMVERTLADLLEAGRIRKVGAGKSTEYVANDG